MQLTVNRRTLNLATPQVMGILNVTPDSFSDGGRYQELDRSIDHASSMVAAGATIIDVGGESTRPGAGEVDEEEEIERVVPVVSALVRRFDVFVSVDTSKAQVIRECADAGAHMINDVRALSEPGALAAAGENQLLICLVHMQNAPVDMQYSPHYTNVLEEVKSYLMERIECCEAAGVERSRLLIDPGFGFGKNLNHNYHLLAKLSTFHHLGRPLVVGMSRKSMIGQVTNTIPTKRLAGSVACAAVAAMQGVQIIRAHDVKPTVEALQIVQATLSAKETYFI